MQKLIEWILSLFRKPEPKPEHKQLVAWIGVEKFAAAAGLTLDRAQEWYPDVRAACLEFGIDTPQRVAAFLAQVGHESGGFRYTREIWGPTDAQKRYEGRADLGNVKPGDGSKYRGRGLIQITGRYGYQKASKALGVDLISHPELLEAKPLAARSAAWWWFAHGCNEIADTGDIVALSKRINGGTNGLEDRLRRYQIACDALGLPAS